MSVLEEQNFEQLSLNRVASKYNLKFHPSSEGGGGGGEGTPLCGLIGDVQPKVSSLSVFVSNKVLLYGLMS